MVLPSWLAILPGLKKKRRRVAKLLAPRAFEHAAACERMRVDRNGSVLSVLLIDLEPLAKSRGEREPLLRALTKVFEGRLRITDTPGRLRDGRIGVLLPDTPSDGAWKVADDIASVFEKEGRLGCEVYRYPESDPGDEWGELSDAPSDPHAEAPAPVGSACVADIGDSNVEDSIDTLFAKPMPGWKRATDITLGCLGLLAAAPVIGVCAGLVAATSPGGAFFAQEREGRGGKRFKMYKIRTMTRDADRQKSELRKYSEQDGPAFKMTRDPRVTKVGRVLRALSLDELPQLINVVRGEMSLVGPRPLPIEESQGCAPWQRQRLRVTPGITCIWQVHGRNTVSFDDWIRMDMQYIRRQSPLEDARLLLQTGPSLIMAKGPR